MSKRPAASAAAAAAPTGTGKTARAGTGAKVSTPAAATESSSAAAEPARPKVTFLIIDPQNDFHEGGSLAVAGATADSQRTAQLMNAHLRDITKIVITLDSHHRNHVAHAVSWVHRPSADTVSDIHTWTHPAPFTIISAQDVTDGVWQASDPSRQRAFQKYATDLEAGGKLWEERCFTFALTLLFTVGRFQVCIWPEHCLIGTTGHAVTPSINAAAQAWCGETHRSVDYVWKGQNLNTEMYSAMAAEVPVEKDKETQFNVSLMKKLNSCDKLIVCGQALSHCVNFTTRDIVSRWTGSKSNIIVLSDCTSAINFS
jgi:nicotinamidase/pyrazinamidase